MVDAAYCLDLAGVDLDNPNSRCNELLSKRLGETADGGFRGTVDAASWVGFPA